MQLRNKLIALLGLNIFNYIEATGRYQTEDPMTFEVEGGYEKRGLTRQSNNNLHPIHAGNIALTSAGLGLGVANLLQSKSGTSIGTQPTAEDNQPDELIVLRKVDDQLNVLSREVQILDSGSGMSIGKSIWVTKDLCDIVSEMEQQPSIFEGNGTNHQIILDKMISIMYHTASESSHFTKQMDMARIWYQNCETLLKYIQDHYDTRILTKHYRDVITPMLVTIKRAMKTIAAANVNDNSTDNSLALAESIVAPKVNNKLSDIEKDLEILDKKKDGRNGYTVDKSKRIANELYKIVSYIEQNTPDTFTTSNTLNNILQRMILILSYTIEHTENFTKKMTTEWYENCKIVFEYICNHYDITIYTEYYETYIKSRLQVIGHAILSINKDDQVYHNPNIFNNINNSRIVSALLEMEGDEQIPNSRNTIRSDTEMGNLQKRIQLRDLTCNYLTNMLLKEQYTLERNLATGQVKLIDYIALLNLYGKLINTTNDSGSNNRINMKEKEGQLTGEIKEVLGLKKIGELYGFYKDLIDRTLINKKSRYLEYIQILKNMVRFNQKYQNSAYYAYKELRNTLQSPSYQLDTLSIPIPHAQENSPQMSPQVRRKINRRDIPKLNEIQPK